MPPRHCAFSRDLLPNVDSSVGVLMPEVLEIRASLKSADCLSADGSLSWSGREPNNWVSCAIGSRVGGQDKEDALDAGSLLEPKKAAAMRQASLALNSSV